MSYQYRQADIPLARTTFEGLSLTCALVWKIPDGITTAHFTFRLRNLRNTALKWPDQFEPEVIAALLRTKFRIGGDDTVYVTFNAEDSTTPQERSRASYKKMVDGEVRFMPAGKLKPGATAEDATHAIAEAAVDLTAQQIYEQAVKWDNAGRPGNQLMMFTSRTTPPALLEAVDLLEPLDLYVYAGHEYDTPLNMGWTIAEAGMPLMAFDQEYLDMADVRRAEAEPSIFKTMFKRDTP